ncbi:TetR/AcrR family transcriptional regulator [Chryseolinea lacunae]|uniref:TetR/AcrR family transcriptional regulator n=1 Tax=Chryseolinea lacunae TaxID=2801331 RepID=A0ABS1KNL3_9BACT|nr:TetR/AcrR family transcriptional regulator [Chryseolinea lacunae]MBL0740918.1 TetR/AcrR family transcriptional regulator [Chryseolinea lacunae]
MSKAARTKAFIIEKTAPVFNTKGYAGTSINDLSEATGLTKGSIYGNFTSKDDVALAAFDYNLQKVQNVVKSEMSKCTTVLDQLLVYVNVYDNFEKFPFPLGGCPILNTSTEADDTHPELRKRANAAILSWKNALVGLIEKGVKMKELRAQIDAEQTAVAIIALIEGGIMIAKVTGKSSFRKAVMQSVEKMIRGLV